MRRGSSAACVVGLLAIISLGSVVRSGFGQTDTNTVLKAVILLERSGQYDEAEARCLQILQQNPDNADAKRLLAEIQNIKHKPFPSTMLRESLDEIIIPEVNFREANVGDVIDYLKAESQKVSGADTPINFVWEAPESFKTAKITLNLRQCPTRGRAEIRDRDFRATLSRRFARRGDS